MGRHLRCPLKLLTQTTLLLSLLLPLFKWPTHSKKEVSTTETDGPKKQENVAATLEHTVRLSRWTKLQALKADTKTNPSLGRNFHLLAAAHLTFPSFSFFSSIVSSVFLSFALCFPCFLCCVGFHFKLDCWDPNLSGGCAKTKTKKRRAKRDGKSDRGKVLVKQCELGNKSVKNFWVAGDEEVESSRCRR